ncbi:MAG: cellulase family glycosylhydrolase [Bacilli bacterium]|nr:cellulase family glycosylhydrolase [Bacilli bacterium]
MLASLFSCTENNDNGDEKEKESDKPITETFDLFGEFDDSDYLKIDLDSVLKNKNKEEIYLRGVNAGGYLVTEKRMCAASMSRGTTDHYTLTNKMVERFGAEKTLKLWKYYRDNFWTEHDFDNIKNMNMNVIRLPFSYMSVDPDFNNVRRIEGQKYNFELLDSFIEGAAKRKIYVILDLHGAYGSQNGQDHSGQVFGSADEVDFYSNEEKMNKTIDLWKALAEHYKGVSSIAGYDLLNEPGEKGGSTTTRHREFLDNCYKAIRTIDSDRPLIMESCWDGPNLPQPSKYYWQNVIYSFHHYSGAYNVDSNRSSWNSKFNSVNEQNFHVPLYMGEFNLYNVEDSWKDTLNRLNTDKWHWTSWTYKLNLTQEGKYGGRGIYYSHVSQAVIDKDSYEEIMEKWYEIDTAYESVTKMTFESGTTLESIMRMYCSNN